MNTTDYVRDTTDYGRDQINSSRPDPEQRGKINLKF